MAQGQSYGVGLALWVGLRVQDTKAATAPEKKKIALSPLSSPFDSPTFANDLYYGEDCEAATSLLTSYQTPQPKFTPDSFCLEPGCANGRDKENMRQRDKKTMRLRDNEERH